MRRMCNETVREKWVDFFENAKENNKKFLCDLTMLMTARASDKSVAKDVLNLIKNKQVSNPVSILKFQKQNFEDRGTLNSTFASFVGGQ